MIYIKERERQGNIFIVRQRERYSEKFPESPESFWKLLFKLPTPQETQIMLFIDRLSFWHEFMMNQTTRNRERSKLRNLLPLGRLGREFTIK